MPKKLRYGNNIWPQFDYMAIAWLKEGHNKKKTYSNLNSKTNLNSKRLRFFGKKAKKREKISCHSNSWQKLGKMVEYDKWMSNSWSATPKTTKQRGECQTAKKMKFRRFRFSDIDNFERYRLFYKKSISMLLFI